MVFSTVHVVGSNNDLVPWAAEESDEQKQQRTGEFDERLAADVAWLKRTFDTAREQRAPGIVIAMQANTFISRLYDKAAVTGFTELVEEIAELAAGYDGEVLLLQGDTHACLTDSRSRTAAPSTAASRRRRRTSRGSSSRVRRQRSGCACASTPAGRSSSTGSASSSEPPARGAHPDRPPYGPAGSRRQGQRGPSAR